MSLKSVFKKLSETLAVPEFPGRTFEIGIPPTAPDGPWPGFYLELVKGMYKSNFLFSAESTHTFADFNALIVLHKRNIPEDEELNTFTIGVGESLIRRVIDDNDSGVYKSDGDNGFRAEPFSVSHYFTGLEHPVASVSLTIRASQFGR